MRRSPHRAPDRPLHRIGAGLAAAVVVTALVAGPAGAADPAPSTDPVGSTELLSDPYLQAPSADGVHVVWNTAFAGEAHVVLVGEPVAHLSEDRLRAAAAGTAIPGVTIVAADSTTYSRMAEDSSSHLPEDRLPEAGSIVPREVWRHEAEVTGLTGDHRTPYRVVSLDGDDWVASGTFSLQPLPGPGSDLTIMLTSDHQAMANTPANLQKAAETLGDIDAVFMAGDLANVPDRASEWFDDTRGSAFFAAAQGNGGRASTEGTVYRGGEILQNAVLYPSIGNHEVMGRRDGATSLGGAFGSPVPREIAEQAYEQRSTEINPSSDPAVRERWIENNSFSTRTYEELFTLPDDSPGGETYYATTYGDVRLISLYSTRIWRGADATPDPTERTSTSRYQEAAANLDDPLAQGYGEHIFEDLAVGSEQYEWLSQELASEEYRSARYKIVMLHEGPQGLGDNIMPSFAHPQRIEEHDDSGALVGVRYEYPASGNILLNDLEPLLESSDVDLVYNGHSHLWNRFRSDNGTQWLEASNTGNSYGAFDELSGRSRPVPPEPWDASNYLAQGNPGGLKPIYPTGEGLTDADGNELPFVQSNDHAVFNVLHTATNTVTSYIYDVRTPEKAPVVLDEFTIGDPAPTPSATPTSTPTPSATPTTPSATPTLPSATPTVTATPGAEPSGEPTPTAAPVAGDSDRPGPLAATGGSALGGVLLAAAALAGGAALLIRRR